MMKGLRTFLYELKYAFLQMKRHIMLCFSAISAIGITLLLIGSILIIGLHVNYFSNDVQKDLSIHVILNEDIGDKTAISNIQNEIKKIKNVSKVEVSSKDDELELMIKEKGDAFKAYRGEINPLSNAFFVYVKNASSIRKTSVQIQKIDGVSSTAFGGDSVTSLVDMLVMIQKIGLGIVALLILLSLYLIYNTIRTTIDFALLTTDNVSQSPYLGCCKSTSFFQNTIVLWQKMHITHSFHKGSLESHVRYPGVVPLVVVLNPILYPFT